jgi:aspartate dehydrogenase
MRRVGLVGLGTIGRFVVENLPIRCSTDVSLVGVCVRGHQVEEARRLVSHDTEIFTDIRGLLQKSPDVVVEAAGRDAAKEYGAEILRSGKELYLLSVGILADPDIRAQLIAVAKDAGGQISIPAGALAGFDGLLALAKDGIQSVRYVSTKPVTAWIDTPAEYAFALNAISEPTVIFSGNAGDAARLYPKNANLAASVALAGIGFDRTEVVLIADPGAECNSATLEAAGTVSRLSVRIQGPASFANPKTSAIVGASVLSALDNGGAAIRFV